MSNWGTVGRGAVEHGSGGAGEWGVDSEQLRAGVQGDAAAGSTQGFVRNITIAKAGRGHAVYSRIVYPDD